MKLNLGCGQNKLAGFVNIDKFAQCQPDLVMDLEITPWSFESSSVDTVMMNHSLEHMGQQTSVFLAIVQELYRVCKPGAHIQVNVPHPRHRDFLNDPTHVRAITPEMWALFSKSNCVHWAEVGASNSPLALYLDVDFEVVEFMIVIEQKYRELLQSGQLTQEQLMAKMETENNIASEYQITLAAIK
jgi:predicted SAM-dependent methyltransferase